ncbi:conserved hypothetical protein [Echinococcus multilocularis]|uniref:Uncharacterized protein n=1 Tax=Echinococcus multilocularis TaxID=6211 RepID=A0A068YK07_ECHMU|nr:conserved hypothetical protein [Echinococcus multilocularis]
MRLEVVPEWVERKVAIVGAREGSIRAFAEQRLDSAIVKKCLQDKSISTDFLRFFLIVLKASVKHDTTIELCEYRELFRLIKDVLPFVRHGYGDFVRTLANLSSSILHNHSITPCAFNELCEESRVFLSTALYVPFVDFLLCLLRVSPLNIGAKLNETQMPNDALSLFSDLLQQIGISGTPACSSLPLEDLKEIMTSQTYMKFFDVLRAFPITAAHSALRLLAWWRFLCLLPEKMLSDGFRRFVSPFLANLVGRYISITASLGNPKYHRYQLSSTSVYNGDATSQDLAAHVFSCIFDYPELEPELFLKKKKLPKLSVSTSFLSAHNYQLLVAVFHWLRYLSGSGKSVGDQKIGDIWVKCLKRIRKAISDFSSNDEVLRETFIQQSLDLSLRLVSPQTPCGDSPSSNSLIEPSNIDISRNPSPGDCVTVLHEIADSLDFEKMSLELKSTLNYDICASCLDLISVWHRDGCSSNLSADLALEDIMKDLSLLAVESVEKDVRLSVKVNIVATAVDDHLKLLRELLAKLVPECVNFVDTHLKLLDALYCIPSSGVSVTLNTAKVNEAGLQVWISLADRLTQLTTLHKRVTDLPKSNTKNEKQNSGSGLSTMFAFCLAPVFLAGSSTTSPPPELEQKVLSTLFRLFRVLHAGACLLTSIPTNSWIDKLSDLIIALIQNVTSEFEKKMNLRIVSNFLSFMVKSAEAIEENFKDPFSPSKWRVRKDRLLGQMTGPVNAISCCLGAMPLEQSEISVCNSVFVSPTRRQSSRSRNPLVSYAVTSGSMSPTRLYEVIFLESKQQQHQSPQTTHSVTYNLLHSLWLILRRHIRSVETLLLLIEFSSTGLLALAKRLNSAYISLRDSEAPAIIVTAFEAFVTLAWNRLQKCFCKPGVVETPRQQKEQELKPLKLPHHAVRQLLVFFEAAVCLASSPFSALEHRFSAASFKSASSSPVSLEYSKITNYEAASRRRKIFIMCIVSLWDTLVVSAPPETADLQGRIRDLTGQFSRCLASVTSPQVSLHRRVTFPDWIPPTLLWEQEVEQSGAEDDPPWSSAKMSSAQKSPGVSRRLPRGVCNKEPEEEPRQGNNLESTQEVSPGYVDTTNSSQLPSSQTPPRQSLQGSFLASRRLGTATDPRESLPPRRASIIARRRLSLAAPQAASQPPPVPQQIQRCLFSDDGNDGGTGVAASSTSAVLKASPSRSRKRVNPDNLDRRPPPNLADFEDSTQFVFILPSDCASKRMRLTEHQKERQHEQRQAYLPAMYNNLDISNAPASSNLYPSISSSSVDSSQSLISPARFKAPTPSVGPLDSLAVADPQPSTFLPKATNATTSTSSGGAASAFEATQGSQKESSIKATNISNVSHQSDKTGVESAPNGSAFEEEAPISLELEGPEGISEGDVDDDVEEAEEEAGADASIVVGTEPSQYKSTSTEDALATPRRHNALTLPSSSSMLSASPVVPRSSSAVLRSPLVGGPAGLRAQKILELGLAKAAERSKQRMLLSASRTNSQFTSPIASPSIKQSDSPGTRPGILRDITTPRPKTRVSFVEQPTVFILDSSESSPNASGLKESDSSVSKTFSVVPIPSLTINASEEMVVADSQDSQQAEVFHPPDDVASPLHDQAASEGAEVRQAESYSPPSLSSVSSRRRKSASPRRCVMINRMSRGTLLSFSGSSRSTGTRTHPLTRRRLFTSSENCGSSSLVSPMAATVEGADVDLDALTCTHLSPLSVVISKASQDLSLVSEMTTAIRGKELMEAAVGKEGGLFSGTRSTVQAVSPDHVTEKHEKEDVNNNEDMVESSQEPADAEVIIAPDTEVEQIGEQTEKSKEGTEVQQEPVDVVIGVTVANVAQGDAIGNARRTLGTLRDQLLLVPREQRKELLLEALALFKDIIP